MSHCKFSEVFIIGLRSSYPNFIVQAKKQKIKMKSEKKVTKYLKSKDLDDDIQLQQDVNIMIKQAFSPNSEFGQVT